MDEKDREWQKMTEKANKTEKDEIEKPMNSKEKSFHNLALTFQTNNISSYQQRKDKYLQEKDLDFIQKNEKNSSSHTKKNQEKEKEKEEADSIQVVKTPSHNKLACTININSEEFLEQQNKVEAATVKTPMPKKPEQAPKQKKYDPSDPFKILGSTLNRKFEIEKFLGQGGMGAAYLAINNKINQKVAVKILQKSPLISKSDVERFFKEASIAASIKHPNIVEVYDLDETERFHYIVMEYIEGKNLDTYVREKKFLPVSETITIIKDAALAFKVIHNLGLVHRDIKPANLMLTPTRKLKIMDFGIVKELNSSIELTGASTIVGTPQFMPPELITKKLIDNRSDIYSLGTTFYFLLTGKYCFEGTPMQLMYKVVNMLPMPPEEHNPTIPREISRIIMTMIEKRHEDRYQNMQEVYDVLQAYEENIQ